MDFEENLYDRIVEGWESAETNTGVPYFINHKTERTSWDHPYFTKLLEELGQYDEVKYAAYRTGLKLRWLQKTLNMHHVQLVTIKRVFDEQGYPEGNSDVIKHGDLLNILVHIYRSSGGPVSSHRTSEILAALILNLLQNLFDIKRLGSIRVSSAKVVLVTLCAARLMEKYRFYYQELRDPSTYISQRHLTFFLEDIVQIPDLLHESGAFGRSVDPAVVSCCQMGQSIGGVSEDVFYTWLQREPQTLVWLPTFHRVATVETVKHEAKCSICKACPIIGFRYRCLQCFSFDICQQCFFTGKTRKNHKLKHPIQEYCLNTTSKDDTKAFMKTLKNNLSKKQRRKSKLKYLPIEVDNHSQLDWTPRNGPPTPDVHSEVSENAHRLADLERESIHDVATLPIRHTRILKSADMEHMATDEMDEAENTGELKRQREELEAVIRQLEHENRALYQQLVDMKEMSDTESNLSQEDKENNQRQLMVASREVLEDHNSRLASHLTSVQGVLKEKQNSYIPEHLSCLSSPHLSVPVIKVSPSTSSGSRKSPYSQDGYSSCRKSPYSQEASSESSWKLPSRHHDVSSDQHHQAPYMSMAQKGGHQQSDKGSYSYDSLDNLDVSASHFSLPSPTQSRDFSEEESELRHIVDRVEKLFPADLSYSAESPYNHYEQNEMLEAATTIGAAMSEFVSKAVQPTYNYE